MAKNGGSMSREPTASAKAVKRGRKYLDPDVSGFEGSGPDACFKTAAPKVPNIGEDDCDPVALDKSKNTKPKPGPADLSSLNRIEFGDTEPQGAQGARAFRSVVTRTDDTTEED